MAIDDAADRPIADEIRTHRLVIVDGHGVDRAVIGMDGDVVHVSLVSGGVPQAEVLAYAGSGGGDGPAAGLELWWGGNAMTGASLVGDDDGGTVHCFTDPENGCSAF